MAALEDLRVRLDGIDEQIVRLYEERMKVCEEVGELKVQNWGRVLDRQRERNKLNDVASKASNEFNKKGIQELYEQLMSMSRKLQYQQMVEAGALGKLPCKPEAGQARLRPGDAFLLCSDGFWEHVYQEEMLADLLKAETPKQWAEGMLLRHIRRTPPGNDNFSLITVFAEEEL